MPFPKGQSGNPKGRPPRARALATLLEKSAKAKPEYGQGKSNKELFAEKVWQALTTGRIEFPPAYAPPPEPPIDPEGLDEIWANAARPPAPPVEPRYVYLEVQDFIRLTKVVLSHLDGPVNAGDTNINVNAANNGKVKDFNVNINVVPGRTEPPDLGDDYLLNDVDDDDV